MECCTKKEGRLDFYVGTFILYSILPFGLPGKPRSILTHKAISFIIYNMNRTTFGSIESVSMPKVGIDNIEAKVDTGAWSGALHCTAIHEKDAVLYFTPLGKKKLATSTNSFELRQVKSTSGHVVDRYIVPLTVEIRGKTYHTTVGLSNRSNFQREMLLGRKFLLENNILVDVTLTVESDYEAEKYL